MENTKLKAIVRIDNEVFSVSVKVDCVIDEKMNYAKMQEALHRKIQKWVRERHREKDIIGYEIYEYRYKPKQAGRSESKDYFGWNLYYLPPV